MLRHFNAFFNFAPCNHLVQKEQIRLPLHSWCNAMLFWFNSPSVHRKQHCNRGREKRSFNLRLNLKHLCLVKDVRAHCYCASLVRTLFIRHARATSFASACTKSKSQQNIELMTFALTWCANIFVECSVNPTVFSADHFLF